MKVKKRAWVAIELFLVASVFAFGSCARTDLKTIDTAQLHRKVVDNAYQAEAGRAAANAIVDIRDEVEYRKEHVLSAINVPEKDFEKKLPILPKDRNAVIVIYSNGGKEEIIGKWVEKAIAAGFRNIELYFDGFKVWNKNRMPIAPLN